jgi:hypothetical protein
VDNTISVRTRPQTVSESDVQLKSKEKEVSVNFKGVDGNVDYYIIDIASYYNVNNTLDSIIVRGGEKENKVKFTDLSDFGEYVVTITTVASDVQESSEPFYIKTKPFNSIEISAVDVQEDRFTVVWTNVDVPEKKLVIKLSQFAEGEPSPSVDFIRVVTKDTQGKMDFKKLTPGNMYSVRIDPIDGIASYVDNELTVSTLLDTVDDINVINFNQTSVTFTFKEVSGKVDYYVVQISDTNNETVDSVIADPKKPSIIEFYNLTPQKDYNITITEQHFILGGQHNQCQNKTSNCLRI